MENLDLKGKLPAGTDNDQLSVVFCCRILLNIELGG